MKSRIGPFIGSLLSLLLISSCGGGGGGGGPVFGPGTGQVGATGTISNFGSVIVNGVEWGSASASFIQDGNPVTEDDLQIGQVVTVKGTLDSDSKGTAASIEFRTLVEGTAQLVNPLTSTFTVLGQFVKVDADTSVDADLPGNGIDAITGVGDPNPSHVAVSGYIDSGGVIHATRVEETPVAATDPDRVRGKVSPPVNTLAQTLIIGGLTVNYATAVLTGFAGNPPQAGDFVHVKGTFNNVNLLATSLELEQPAAPAASGDAAGIEGLINRFASAADFDVQGVTVTASSALFTGGTTADLHLNGKVEVEGTVDTTGRIVASTVEIRTTASGQNVEIATNIDAVNVDAANPTQGTVTMFGITVDVNEFTRMEDKSNAGVRTFSLADLEDVSPTVPERLRVSGKLVSGVIDASRLEREEEDPSDIVLQGPVSSPTSSDFMIASATASTDNLTLFFRADGTVINTQSDFFALLQVGDIVRVATTASAVTGNNLLANEVRNLSR